MAQTRMAQTRMALNQASRFLAIEQHLPAGLKLLQIVHVRDIAG